MHPLKERACDELLEHPGLRTPPPEPIRPPPPRIRKPRVFKLPPKPPLMSEEDYAKWCNHQKELQMTRCRVEARPPPLFPELYLKPRRLDQYARQLGQNMRVNKDLLRNINIIQRTGGYVDCWSRNKPTNTYNKLLCQQRQRQLNEIREQNMQFHKRLKIARSEQPLTSELEEQWKDTKRKLILGASATMEIWVEGGAKIGRVSVELFSDVAPRTCQLFLHLVHGDPAGHAYAGTKIFRIVPNLYCRAGDVVKDNGFGCYQSPEEPEDLGPENFELKHSVPGVMSMVVTPDNEVCGQFNIIFKPLPQFDGKHVVFGRIVGGPSQALERISALGRPLGTTSELCMLRECGWTSRAGRYRPGNRTTIEFPDHKKKIKLH